MSDSDRRRFAFVLFDGFELLDVFGPLELFGACQIATRSRSSVPATS